MNRCTFLAAAPLATGITRGEPTAATSEAHRTPLDIVGTWSAITTFHTSGRLPERSLFTFLPETDERHGLLTVAMDGVAIPGHGWWRRRADGSIGFAFVEPLAQQGQQHLIAVTQDLYEWASNHFVSHGGGVAYSWPTSPTVAELPVLAIGLTTITARRIEGTQQ